MVSKGVPVLAQKVVNFLRVQQRWMMRLVQLLVGKTAQRSSRKEWTTSKWIMNECRDGLLIGSVVDIEKAMNVPTNAPCAIRSLD